MVYSTAKLNFSFPSLFPLSPPFKNRGWSIDATLAALENKVHSQQIFVVVSPQGKSLVTLQGLSPNEQLTHGAPTEPCVSFSHGKGQRLVLYQLVTPKLHPHLALEV